MKTSKTALAAVITLILLSFPLYGQIRWQYVEPGTPSNLYYASCRYGSKIFLAGTGSMLFTSSDMGNSWQDMSDGFRSKADYWPQDDRANSISFVSENTGFVCDANSLYKTTDGGKNWSKLFTAFPFGMSNILFADEKTGWAGGFGNSWRTSDGGKTFTKMNATGGTVRGFRALDKNRIWMFTGHNFDTNEKGGIKYSGDGGVTWTSQEMPFYSIDNVYYSIVSMDMSPSGIGIASVAGWLNKWNMYVKFQIRTTDYGRSWATSSRMDCAFPGVISISDSLWIMVGNDSWNAGGSTYKTFIYRSTDYGITWTEVPFSKTKPAPVTVQMMGDRKTLIASGWYGSIYRSADYGMSWQEISNVTPTMNDIEFGKDGRNTEFGMGVGNGAFVTKTLNGGQSWEKVNMDSLHGAALTALEIKNNEVWIGDIYGKVLRSRDAGSTWTWASTPFNTERDKYVMGTISDIKFRDSLKGAILTKISTWSEINPSYVFYTKDGGSTWKAVNLPPKMLANSLSFINDSSFYVGGMYSPPGVNYGAGFIWRTTDAGRTWDTNSVSRTIYKLRMKDHNYGTAGANGALLSTTDGGRTWQVPYSNNASCYALEYESDQAVWASAGNELLRSSDGGAKWARHEPGIANLEWIKSIGINASGKLFASLERGGFLTFNTNNSTDVHAGDEKNRNQSAGINYKLDQNFPNPFNPVTNISFSIPQSAEVKLKVYDLLGREVITLTDEYWPAGNHRLQFNAASLPSGVYIYTLQAGQFRDSKKLLLMK